MTVYNRRSTSKNLIFNVFRKFRIFIYCDFTVTLYMLRIQLRKRKEMFYLTTHSTHYIYGYMESDIW